MNYIIYGTDGRVIKTNFTELIQVGNNNVNEIFVSIQGLDTADYTVSGLFTLPDKTLTTEIGVLEQDCEYESGVYADGYLITITEDETKYAGRVFLSIQLLNASDNSVLYTYKVVLTINDTGVATDITSISLDQYTNLLTYLSTQLGLKEDLANKVTSLSNSSTDDEYPSAKAVFDELQNYLPFIEENGAVTLEDIANTWQPYILKRFAMYYVVKISSTYPNHCAFEIESLLTANRWYSSDAELSTLVSDAMSSTYLQKYALESDIPTVNHLYRHSVVIKDIDDFEFLNVYITSNSSVPLNNLNSFVSALDDSGTIEVRIYDVQNEENALYIEAIQTQQDEYRIYMVSLPVAQTYTEIADDDTFTDTVTTIL